MTEVDESISSLIDFLKGDECKKDQEHLLQSVKLLRTKSAEIGLSPSQILELCKVATSGKFSTLLACHLIRSLIPRQSVPEDAALCALSRICQDILHLKVKSLLLRWLVVIFDVILAKSRIYCLYGFIFHLIFNDTLCPTVCHLLFLMTRKCDVTHYRISKLLQLQKKIGSQSHLCGLFSVYRVYQPSLITYSGGYRTFFKRTDKPWQQGILAVQQKYGLSMVCETLGSATTTTTTTVLSRKKETPLLTNPVPRITDRMEHQPVMSLFSKRLSIHEVKSFHEVLENVGKLDMDAQAFTLLSSSTLQHVLAVSSDRSLAVRLSFWFHHHLSEVICASETARGRELLTALVNFSNLIHECMPVSEAFLFRYLCMWNGTEYEELILSLVSKLRLLPYSTLYDLVLSPLRKLFTFSSHLYFKVSVIVALSSLLKNYLLLEWPRYKAMWATQQSAGVEHTDGSCHTMFPTKVEKLNPREVIVGLIDFVDKLCVEGLQAEGDDFVLLHYALRFHKQVSKIYVQHRKPIIALPSVYIFQKSLFSLSPGCVSTMCEILNNHTLASSEMVENGILDSSYKEEITTLNQYLVDAYDTLWRRRSFKPHCTVGSVLFAGLDLKEVNLLLSHTEELSANRMFCVDRHPALISIVAQYLVALKKDASELGSAEFVFDEQFMEFLESRGATGVAKFIRNIRQRT